MWEGLSMSDNGVTASKGAACAVSEFAARRARFVRFRLGTLLGGVRPVLSLNRILSVRRLLRDPSAATATEYAVMLALVLCVILAAVTLFGQNLGAEYEMIDGRLFG
jgi:Flp pilus assembly pilin Flp